MTLFRRLGFLCAMIVVVFLAHHTSIYLHEWTHGLVAWLGGYKSHPFDIHYGSRWITLLDIDESVKYAEIHSRSLVGAIAIAPIVMQIILFPLGLYLLKNVKMSRWVFAFVYWLTFFFLAQTYSYIPIRTFAQSDDIYNFLSVTHLTPWAIAIPGTVYVLCGIIYFLKEIEPYAEKVLGIVTRTGSLLFFMTTAILFFGYYGTPGYFKPDLISKSLTSLSWVILIVVLFTHSARLRSKFYR